MKLQRQLLALACAATLVAGGSAWAKLTQGEADQLGITLTPVGAEKAGNKEGTIPAWDGGLTTPPPVAIAHHIIRAWVEDEVSFD